MSAADSEAATDVGRCRGSIPVEHTLGALPDHCSTCAEHDGPRRRTEAEARRCSQSGCPGDGRYQPPGRGHMPDCQHNAVAWVWETVTPPPGGYDPAELRALRRVAEAATPGSWDAVVMGSEGYDVRAPNLDSPIRRIRVARCGYEKWETDRANAEHIAAFDPPTVLALLDEIERLRTPVLPPTDGRA